MASYVHLPEAVLRVHETLREEEILNGIGVDVGNSQIIADDFHLGLQTGNLQLTGGLRERGAHQVQRVTTDSDECENHHESDDQNNADPSTHPRTVLRSRGVSGQNEAGH